MRGREGPIPGAAESVIFRTPFTDLLGLEVPIQQAGMPGLTTVALVSEVSRAGGLGMIAGTGSSPGALSREIDEVASRTTGVFGTNFLMPFLDREAVEVAARKTAIVEFFYGRPDSELVESVHRLGARVGWQVGSVAEARQAEGAGCDVVVAQGVEAGGHVRGTTPALALLDEVRASLRVPVVVAGGVSDPSDAALHLTRGASGVRLGTRFAASAESAAHPEYIERIVRASAGDTSLTTLFSVGWPDAPHRVLTSCISAASADSAEYVGTSVFEGSARTIPRYSVVPPTLATSGRIEAMALYAGTSVSGVHRVEPAGRIVREWAAAVEKALGEQDTRARQLSGARRGEETGK